MEIIPQKGTDRPALKYLYRHVRSDIIGKWHDIGVELFDVEDEGVLNTIKINNPGDADKCTAEMLQLWRDRQADASWNQLIQAFRAPNIKLEHLASKIEGMLSKDSDAMQHGKPLRKRGQNDIATSDLKQFSSSDAKKVKTMDENDEIDFTKYKNVMLAFMKLLTTFQDNVPESRLKTIKTCCIAGLTHKKFSECIETQADNVEDFFHILSKNKVHCNWLNISLLKVIAIALENKKLNNLLESYEKAIYSRKLQEVWDDIPQQRVKTKYYDEVNTTFSSKNPDDVTVKELIECNKQLANKIAVLVDVTEKCLRITSLVPTDKVYQLFLSKLTIPQQGDFLQIGTWVIHHPKAVLHKLKMEFAMALPLTLLIGYYHGVLLRDINTDSLFDDMCSNCLLDVNDQSLISAGHSVHHRNWLLLEHIRHMDAKAFTVFCELVQNIWPLIGSQLITVFNTIPEIQDKTTDFTEAETTTHKLHGQVSYFKPSLVHIAFLCFIDQLQEILQHGDYKTLIAQCENIMACTCKHENIKLFSNIQIEKLKQYNAILVLLWSLSYLFTWSNHSILRMLLTESSSEALQLLDEFDSRVDPLQSVASYPLPHFSSLMIPDDANTHTILAIRCDQELYKSTLQYVYDIQSLIMEKCHITQHCLQLLAVRSDPTILYWTIPKLVVNLISKQVPQHSDYLYSKGVLEVLVYPEPLLSTGDDVSIGSLAFKVAINEEHDDIEQIIKTLQENIESHKANEIVLEEHFEEVNVTLKMKEANLQSVTKSNKQLQEKMTQIKLENNHLKQQIEQLSSKLLEMEKKNQLSRQNEQLNSDLLKKVNEQNEQLNSKLLEIAEKKDELNIENLKINSELRENNDKLNELDKQNEQLKSELQMIKETNSKVQDVKDSPNNQDDLTELKDMGHECQLQKHNQLKRELADAKKIINEGSKAAPAVNDDVVSKDTNDKHVAKLEENCARLRKQLKMKQMEAQKWKDACSLLEQQLQAVLSPSASRRFFKREDSLLLGTGKYGIVHRVNHNDKWFAGKTIHKSLYVNGFANQTRVTLVCNEFVKLDHSNVEAFVAVEQSFMENIPMLLTEYFPENLDDFVSRYKTNLPFCEQLSLATNMADGLSYLHRSDVTHGNLHGRNILIDYWHQAKIGDFVCSQLCQAGIIHNATDSSDTQAFIPPELSEDKAVNSMESDVFALGVLFLQVFVQEIPTTDRNLITKLDDCHPIQPLVYSCISEDKEVRPDCTEICDQLGRSKDTSHCIINNCLHGKKMLPSLVSSMQTGRGQMKWIRLNNLPHPMHSAYAIRLKNNLYVAGGVGSEREIELAVFEFNLFYGNWRRLPDPQHKSCIPHAVCGKLVLFGGFDVATNKMTNQVSTYDKDNNLWTSFYPNLKECRCFPAVMSHANHVIVAGGKNREDILDDFEVMHTLECQWRKLSRCLPKRIFNFSATISNHWLFLVRTIGSYPPSSSKQAYAIAMEDVIPSQDLDSVKMENDWTRLSDVPHMNVTIAPDYFPPLLVGGSDNQGNTVNDMLMYNATEKLWRQVETLSSNRANVAVATISNHAIIVIGGCTDSRTKDTCKSSAVNIVELGYMDESTV